MNDLFHLSRPSTHSPAKRIFFVLARDTWKYRDVNVRICFKIRDIESGLRSDVLQKKNKIAKYNWGALQQCRLHSATALLST